MNRATTQSNSSASEGTSDSEIVMMDLAVLSELNKGLYCASKAQATKDDSEGKRSWIQNANAAMKTPVTCLHIRLSQCQTQAFTRS